MWGNTPARSWKVMAIARLISTRFTKLATSLDCLSEGLRISTLGSEAYLSRGSKAISNARYLSLRSVKGWCLNGVFGKPA